MAENILTLSNIRKSFGDLEVLKDISISVDKGEVVSIIGSSGSGKSTCARLAARLTGYKIDIKGESQVEG